MERLVLSSGISHCGVSRRMDARNSGATAECVDDRAVRACAPAEHYLVPFAPSPPRLAHLGWVIVSTRGERCPGFSVSDSGKPGGVGEWRVARMACRFVARCPVQDGCVNRIRVPREGERSSTSRWTRSGGMGPIRRRYPAGWPRCSPTSKPRHGPRTSRRSPSGPAGLPRAWPTPRRVVPVGSRQASSDPLENRTVSRQ